MRTEAERIRLAKEICERYAADGKVTLEAVCLGVGITHQAFHKWVAEVAEVAGAFVLSQKEHGEQKHRFDLERMDRERELAHAGAEVLLKGGKEETIKYSGDPEVDPETGEPTGRVKWKRAERTTKTLCPCPSTVKDILSKTDPKFKESLNVNLGGRLALDLDTLPEHELDEVAKSHGLDPYEIADPGRAGAADSPDTGKAAAAGAKG